MGFLQPNLPDVDHEVWGNQPRAERIVPMAKHFARHGFGTPDVMVIFYFVKILLYVLVGWLLVLSTPGIDGFTDFSSWWENPVVFYKFVLWTMLFEVLGLGCGFGPLNLRFLPPLGSFLYWLRPSTIRLPPWPGKVPLTRGDNRGLVDVALYAGLVGTLAWAMYGGLPREQVAIVLGLLLAIGLRDKTIFLAARGEVYGALAVTYLFVAGDQVIGAKLVLFAIWWGAATSKINKHFPFVVAAMMSNSPMTRIGNLREKFHRDYPTDLRPSRLSGALAHGGTVVEFGVPIVLLVSNGGTLTTVAAIVMICFHLNIISSFPMGVPLEWNVFMIWGIVTMFLAHPTAHVNDLAEPGWVIGLMVLVLGTVVIGNLRPDKVSFLPAMRYYAGNWATTTWCFRGDALERIEERVEKVAMLPHAQLTKIYGSEQEALIPLHMGYAFRGFHTHGRALWTLVPQACGPEHEDYFVMDGEILAGVVLGWNFGDGHMHHEQLIEALQKRCDFQPGDVRVVILEAQPFGKDTQEYRLVDAATGELERGHVLVSEMVVRQPTDTDLPLYPH
ncbi:hypothetical protein ABIE44_003399 [Marmoricola sp. OAE513]|uniref:DUF3556 domain-containing protein n=1 Tax=Marmoricola sp. OAE513 TaxID=2817894 RepID=UPI001AE2CB2D